MLVLFEGIDGCGKATQIDLLKKKLSDEGISYALFKYPSANATMIHAFLKMKNNIDGRTLFLLFAADIMRDQKNVARELKEKKVVILDRYISSTITYQGDHVGLKGGMQMADIFNYLKPDMIIHLDLPAKMAMQRKSNQKELDRFEKKLGFQRTVRKRYTLLKKKKFLTSNWETIDATHAIENISEEINKLILPKINRKK